MNINQLEFDCICKLNSPNVYKLLVRILRTDYNYIYD